MSPLITSTTGGGHGHRQILSTSQNRSLSHSSYHVSYVNTEEIQNQAGTSNNNRLMAATDDEKSMPADSHRFNEEPMMHGISSKEFINSRQGLASHRSAVDIVKMHHLQFKT